MSKISQIKVTLQKLLTEFESIATDKGNLEFVGGLAVGTEVLLNDSPAPDGEYTLEDGRKLVVYQGQISEIKEKEEEPAPEPEVAAEEAPVEEQPQPEPEPEPEDNTLEELKGKVGELESKYAEVMGRMEEIEKKLLEGKAEPASEEFDKMEKPSKPFFRQ